MTAPTALTTLPVTDRCRILQFSQREGRAAWCQRHQVDAAEPWHTVTCVVVEMALLWHDSAALCHTADASPGGWPGCPWA